MEKVKDFIKQIAGIGFTAILTLLIGLYLLFLGYNLFAGISFGVFLTRNWDIFAKLFNEHIKPKIEF